MIRSLNPDVITLDVEMPKMDGLSFLEKLMRLRPMPVVMVSSLTDAGAEVTLRALELGAVDFVSKPKIDIERGVRDYAREITDKLRAAARAKVRKYVPAAPAQKPDPAASVPGLKRVSHEKVIVIGASTGGTEAIREVLSSMPVDCPGILITQHMPPAFTRSFANRLNSVCRIAVKEAQSGEPVLPGHAYIAPGDAHLLLRRTGANYITELSDSPAVNRHRPSVDVLFRSAADQAGRNALAIILTGMGKDGAAAMLELKHAGAWTIAQDEASCVVFGMPREAISCGAVEEVLPLKQIAPRLISLFSSHRTMRV
jgi:two-component system chemotaxis response regulator CheB